MYTKWVTGYVLKNAIQKSITDDIINFFDGFEPGLMTTSSKWETG